MKSPTRLRSDHIRDVLTSIDATGNFAEGWEGYRPLILELAGQTTSPRMLEVGGGRLPLLSENEVNGLACSYTVNDIDAGELALAPAWVDRLHGDISDPNLVTAENEGTFDVIFSHMVFEHVAKPEQGYLNIARLLKPGGVLVNFIPTLYASPFVVNRLMPEKLAARLLKALHPHRNEDEVPKFPAYYRWCTSTQKTRRKLESVGFTDSRIVPFYGHSYYRRIPLLGSLVDWFWPLARRRNWRSMSTFAYILAER